MAYERRSFSGIAGETTLSSDINAAVESFSIASSTGWPDGSNGDFFVQIEDEVIRCESRSGLSVTVKSGGRHADGTAAATHTSGVAVLHVFVSLDADEANYTASETVGKITAAGQVLIGDGTNSLAPLDVKTSGRIIVGNGTTAVSVAVSGDVTMAANGAVTIANNAVTAGKIANNSITAGKLATGAISAAAMFAAGVVDNAALAADAKWEAGDLKWSARSAPGTGWLTCDGSAVSRTTFAALFAAIGTTYGSGNGSTTFNVPDSRSRMLVGVGSGVGLTTRSRGDTGGEETHILTTPELASHTHTQSSHAHAGSSTNAQFSGLGSGAAAGGTAVTFTQATLSITSEAPAIAAAGSGNAHNNMPPFLGANCFIKT